MPSNLVIDVHIFQCHTPCNDRIPPPHHRFKLPQPQPGRKNVQRKLYQRGGEKKLTVK